MSNLTNEQIIRVDGNLSEDIKTDIIERGLLKASVKIKLLIGQDVYASLLTKDATDPGRVNVAIAETHYSLYYILPAINVNATNTGLTRSTGFNESRIELLSYTEVMRIAEDHKTKALEFLSEFLTDSNSDTNTSAVKTSVLNMRAL